MSCDICSTRGEYCFMDNLFVSFCVCSCSTSPKEPTNPSLGWVRITSCHDSAIGCWQKNETCNILLNGKTGGTWKDLQTYRTTADSISCCDLDRYGFAFCIFCGAIFEVGKVTWCWHKISKGYAWTGNPKTVWQVQERCCYYCFHCFYQNSMCLFCFSVAHPKNCNAIFPQENNQQKNAPDQNQQVFHPNSSMIPRRTKSLSTNKANNSTFCRFLCCSLRSLLIMTSLILFFKLNCLTTWQSSPAYHSTL